MTYGQIPSLAKQGYPILYGALLLLAGWGLFTGWKLLEGRQRLLLTCLGIFAFGVTAFHAIAYAEGRHKLTFMPYLLMFSAQGLRSLRGIPRPARSPS